jgi:hypothetical protein
MSDPSPIRIGDRVLVYLDATTWRTSGWLPGTVIRIDPYSAHRSFHWVELDLAAEMVQGATTSLISVLNPRHIHRI